MHVPFLVADVLSTLFQAIISEFNVIAVAMVTVALMILGYKFLFRNKHGEIDIGGFICGAVLLLGAAGLVLKYLPSAGS